MKKSRKKLIWILAICLPIAAAGIWLLALDNPSVYAQARAAGMPLEIADVYFDPAPPEAENAALLLEDLPLKTPKSAYFVSWRLLHGSDPVQRQAQEVLSAHEEAFRRIDKAVQLPHYRPEVDWVAWSPNEILDEPNEVLYLPAGRAVLRAQSGEPEKAVEDVEGLLKLSHLYGQELSSRGRVRRLFAESQAWLAAQLIAPLLPEPEMTRLRRAVVESYTEFDLLSYTRQDIARAVSISRSPGPPSRPFKRIGLNLFLREHLPMHQLKPEERTAQRVAQMIDDKEIRAGGNDNRWHFIKHLPVIPKVGDSLRDREVRHAITLAWIDLHLHYRAKGRYPESLHEISSGHPGEEMQYRQQPGGFEIWFAAHPDPHMEAGTAAAFPIPVPEGMKDDELSPASLRLRESQSVGR